MTKQELMILLHQYTPWEMLHQEHLDKVSNLENLNQSLMHPLTISDKIYGLHLPQVPDTSNSTLSQSLYFSVDEEQDIRIVQHDRFSLPTLHNHDFYELLYVLEGEFVQQINSAKLLMHTGDFCLIPPPVYHSLDVRNYSVVLNILIPKKIFHDILFNNLKEDNILSSFFLGNTYSQNINDYIIFHTNGDIQIQDIILSMCLESINKDKYYNHMLNTNLLMLFGLLLRGYEKTCDLPKIKHKKDSQNFAILKYMEENYRTVTLTQLAGIFSYSPQSMSHRLKQLTGMSFTEYLVSKKMQAAVDLLTNTSLKIKSIGTELGYQNQEHFIRTFRKYYGTTPSSYRAAHQKPVA